MLSGAAFIRLECHLKTSIISTRLDYCRTDANLMVFTSALLILRIFDLVQKVANTVSNEMLLESSGFSSKTAIIPGDVTVGMLLPLHKHCTEIWEQYGIHRTEMALKTIDEINRNPDLLPAIKLGIEIRDSCWAEKVAVEQTIEFIQDLLESRHAQKQQCCPAQHPGGEETCPAEVKRDGGPLLAVIGPGNSANSKAVQNLLQIFRIPQIGYSATSTDLSNKEEFKYYMRVVPPDAFQAQVMVDIIRYFNWTYIGILNSEGNYGEKGYDELSRALKPHDDICVGPNQKIKNTNANAEFDRIVKFLRNFKPKPKVIICFCEGDTVRNIFKAITRFKTLNPTNSSDIDFQWIGSESWADRNDVVESNEDVAMGSLTIRIHSRQIPEFDRYFFQLRPATNTRNPWFNEFWEFKFNCTLANNTNPLRRRDRICTGEEDLSAQYDADKKLAQVVNSIYTVANALHQMHRDKCGSAVGLCANMRPVNGSELFYNYMTKVNFTKFEGMEVSYDPNGDPPARYDIMNFQRFNGSYDYVKVGEWATRYKQDNSTLGILFTNSIQFYNGNNSGNSDPPESVCSRPCGMGIAKKSGSHSKCCWACIPCKETEYLKDEWTCESCGDGFWPTDDRTGCYKLTVEYLRWTNIEAVIATCFAALGICAMIFTTVVFIVFNNTPVVKSTTRELSYIILVGIFLCYAATFVIIQQPTQSTCYIIRIGPGVAFAMMYGALLTKTNRIARILAGSKKRILTKKPRFLTTTAQLVITAILVGLEVSIITAMLIYEPPDIRYDYSRARRVLLLCNTTSLGILAPLGFDFFLICLCTLYAVKTRSLPQNFNEAKFIGFTMYTTCIIWLAFLTIYFGSDSQSITMCFSFSLSATVALILLFFPKIYIIIFKPQQNVRSSYATTKEIRIHYGTTPSTTHESLRYQNRSNPSTKVSSRSSTKASRASSTATTDVADSNFKSRRNFRESVHVPAVPSKIESEGNSDEILAPRSQPVVDFQRRSARHKYFPSQQDFKELSVIEELNSHDDSHPTSQDKSGSDRRDLGVQTDPEILAQMSSGYDASPTHSNLVRSRSQRIRESPKSASAKRTFSVRSGRKKSPSSSASGSSDRSDLPSLVAVRLQQYDRGASGCRPDDSLSPGASPLLPRNQSDSSRSNSVDRSENNSDLEGVGVGHSQSRLISTSVESARSLLPMTTEIVDIADIYNEANRPRLIHNSIESSLNPLMSHAITSSSNEVLSQKSADDSPQVMRSKSTGFISRLRYSLRVKFGGSEHKTPRKTTVANPGALDPEFVQQMVESHDRSVVVNSRSEFLLESAKSPGRNVLNGRDKSESCHEGLKELPIAEELEELTTSSNRDSFEADSPRCQNGTNGEGRRLSELLKGSGVEVDLTNSTLV